MIKRAWLEIRIFALELETDWLFNRSAETGGDLSPYFGVYLERSDRLRYLRWLRPGVDLR